MTAHSPQPALRWGILATGGIAAAFAADLRTAGLDLVAVGSRSQESADAFAARFDIARAHGSYEALAADPEVDIIYVATPHPMHHDDARLALEHGKHVLVEKAFTLNRAEAQDLADLGREKGLLVMEAMWTRYLPHMVRIREIIAAGTLGEIRAVSADHTQSLPTDPAHRLNALELGGGALLDLGIYPLQLAQLVFGPATAHTAEGVIGATGVEESVVVTATHDRRTGDPAAAAGTAAAIDSLAISRVAASMRVGLPNRAAISGPGGFIEFGPRMHAPQSLTVHNSDGTEVIDTPFDGTGLRFEAREAMRCIRAGLLESPGMPWHETLALAHTMDAIRATLGVTYDID